jgi:hypothetical protein
MFYMTFLSTAGQCSGQFRVNKASAPSKIPKKCPIIFFAPPQKKKIPLHFQNQRYIGNFMRERDKYIYSIYRERERKREREGESKRERESKDERGRASERERERRREREKKCRRLYL